MPGPSTIEIDETSNLETVDGIDHRLVRGRIAGVVDGDEPIAGLDRVETGAAGQPTYAAAFELIAPADGSASTIVVEAENRGNALMRVLLGDDFLLGGRRAYARVAWQTGINPDVPAHAQGIGQAIVRDFGRLLRDGMIGGADSPLGSYRHRVLCGWSQGAWFVTTLVAEGFNVDPVDGTGVFDGALNISGTGHVLAVNRFGDDGSPQEPYVRPDAAPLDAASILTRPGSDPLFVDVANYTDFYRLRAGVSAGADVARYRRYDWPAAHAPGALVPPSVVFEVFGCNAGRTVPINPTDFRPHARALLVGLEFDLGAPVVEAQRPASTEGLPAAVEFVLADDQPDGTGDLNRVPTGPTPVPAVDLAGWPVGGVRFAEGEARLGAPKPVAIPPVTTNSIDETCGNFGGWTPRPVEEVLAEWPTVDDHTAAHAAALDALIDDGYVLPLDRAAMTASAAGAYEHAVRR